MTVPRILRRASAAVVLAVMLAITGGCRALEEAGGVPALAADTERLAQSCSGADRRPSEPPPAPTATPSPASAPPTAAAGGSELGGFSLIGPVYPGLAGQLHSSLCDPASDPYGTCI